MIISVRTDEETIEGIDANGIRPFTYIKTLLEKELRKERSKKALRRLKKARVKWDGTSSVDHIRKHSDST